MSSSPFLSQLGHPWTASNNLLLTLLPIEKCNSSIDAEPIHVVSKRLHDLTGLTQYTVHLHNLSCKHQVPTQTSPHLGWEWKKKHFISPLQVIFQQLLQNLKRNADVSNPTETANDEQVTEPLFQNPYLHLSTVHRVRQSFECFVFASLHKVWKLLEYVCTDGTNVLLLGDTKELSQIQSSKVWPQSGKTLHDRSRMNQDFKSVVGSHLFLADACSGLKQSDMVCDLPQYGQVTEVQPLHFHTFCVCLQGKTAYY